MLYFLSYKYEHFHNKLVNHFLLCISIRNNNGFPFKKGVNIIFKSICLMFFYEANSTEMAWNNNRYNQTYRYREHIMEANYSIV